MALIVQDVLAANRSTTQLIRGTRLMRGSDTAIAHPADITALELFWLAETWRALLAVQSTPVTTAIGNAFVPVATARASRGTT